MRALFFCVAVLMALFACDTTVTEGSLYDYSIEQKLGCFCPRGGEWVKIFVKSDAIADAIILSDHSLLPFEEWPRYKTVTGLFDVISSVDTARYELRVVIDTADHYPTYIYFNPKPVVHGDTVGVILDAQMAYTTRNYSRYN